MSLDIEQLRLYVVQPTLAYIGLESASATNLVLGTALVESNGTFLKQIKGPALGLWQMEPETHDDIWDNYLSFRDSLAGRVKLLQTVRQNDSYEELIGNLFYAAAMCRLHYRRVSAPLPGAENFLGMAHYWKDHYNTSLGAGTVEKAVPHFKEVCSYKEEY